MSAEQIPAWLLYYIGQMVMAGLVPYCRMIANQIPRRNKIIFSLSSVVKRYVVRD